MCGNEIGHYFFDSFDFRSEGVNIEEFKTYYPTIAKHLNLPLDTINFAKKVAFENPYKVKPNIVFVMLESVGTAPMSFYGNPLNSTPKMDSIITCIPRSIWSTWYTNGAYSIT